MLNKSCILIMMKLYLSRAKEPHSHILMMGGEVLRDILGSKILAKRDFFGSIPRQENFLVTRKTEIFGGMLEK